PTARMLSGGTVLVTAISRIEEGSRPLRTAASRILLRVRRQFSRTSIIESYGDALSGFTRSTGLCVSLIPDRHGVFFDGRRSRYLNLLGFTEALLQDLHQVHNLGRTRHLRSGRLRSNARDLQSDELHY